MGITDIVALGAVGCVILMVAAPKVWALIVAKAQAAIEKARAGVATTSSSEGISGILSEPVVSVTSGPIHANVDHILALRSNPAVAGNPELLASLDKIMTAVLSAKV